MASALFFSGTTRKTRKTIFFEITMDNDTNWHPRSLPHAKARRKVRHYGREVMVITLVRFLGYGDSGGGGASLGRF
jgi:hypothetical protein